MILISVLIAGVFVSPLWNLPARTQMLQTEAPQHRLGASGDTPHSVLIPCRELYSSPETYHAKGIFPLR